MDGNTPSSPTPFTPPTTEEDRLSWLRLIRSRRVGPGSFVRLMGEYGSAEAALEALPAIACTAGIENYVAFSAEEARREWAAGRRAGARLICLGDALYPAALAALADAPPVLWLRGRTELLSRPMVAVVGARNASSLGGRMARKLAEGLGWHGQAVVSGLARGIDTAAHGAALKSGTLAVMAGGVDVVYPAENAALAAAMADQGALLSEQPFGMSPQARHFPARNRIIAGLAQAVVVIEAAEGSGSLITARYALDQGREVLAVPGHPLDARAAGCNHLIREGARLIRDVADIVEVIGKSPFCGHGSPEEPDPGQPGDRPVTAARNAVRVRPMSPVRNRKATANGPGTPPAAVAALARKAATGDDGMQQHMVAGTAPARKASTTATSTPAPPPGRKPAIAQPAGTRPQIGPTIAARTRTDGMVPSPPAAYQPDPAGQRDTGSAPCMDQALPDVPPARDRGAAARQEAQTTRPCVPDTLTLHRMILSALGPSPVPEDQLIRDLALPAASVAPALLFLELDGRVHRQPGGMLARR